VRSLLLAAVIVLAPACAACGGGSSSATPTTKPAVDHATVDHVFDDFFASANSANGPAASLAAAIARLQSAHDHLQEAKSLLETGINGVPAVQTQGAAAAVSLLLDANNALLQCVQAVPAAGAANVAQLCATQSQNGEAASAAAAKSLEPLLVYRT
jgi:hypothetical protein